MTRPKGNCSNIRRTSFQRAKIKDTIFTDAICIDGLFAKVNLSRAVDLDTVIHLGHSTIGLDTFFLSRGQIDIDFLMGCGMSKDTIVKMLQLVATTDPLPFFSCFLSHSSSDKPFVRLLHSRMEEKGMDVWFDETDMRSGNKLKEQVDKAIETYDRLLIVLSGNSMNSNWVNAELRKAFALDRLEGRRILFPIGLAPYAEIRNWQAFDADHGKDLAVELREYYIPDFSDWQNKAVFEDKFEKLLKDLRLGN